VGPSTVKRYLQRQEQTGSLARTPIVGGVRSIRGEQEAALVAQVGAHPAATLAEHCTWWEQAYGVRLSIATMSRAIRRLGWTRKKRRWWRASATSRSGRHGG
jgi:transposase